jgi:hypothetical protein
MSPLLLTILTKKNRTVHPYTLNGEEFYEYLDFSKAFPEGHLTFHQHDLGIVVTIRKIEVMPLVN